MSDDEARILVEGGPFHRHVQHALAAIIGVLIGGLLGTGGVALIALNAAHEAHHAVQAVEAARVDAIHRACAEANAHHRTAQLGIEALAAKSRPRNPTLAQIRQRQVTIDEFVEALAPKCIPRTQEPRTP